MKKAVEKKKVMTPSQEIAQDAKQTNWLLLGNLKNAQKQFLRIGALLTKMRDKKLYAALHDAGGRDYADIESYAAGELHLGKTSLYKYLAVYAWVSANHPEWLAEKPKGFIPDLSDCADLIWVENELARKNLEPDRRKTLDQLQQKGLQGTLRQCEVDRIRRQGRVPAAGMKALLSKLRSVRKQAKGLKGTPEEIITLLDSAIGILANDSTIKLAGISDIGVGLT